MLRNFKYAVLAVFVIAAIITPTPDMLTQSIIAVPMLVLYGIGILVSFIGEKRRKKKAEPDEEPAG